MKTREKQSETPEFANFEEKNDILDALEYDLRQGFTIPESITEEQRLVAGLDGITAEQLGFDFKDSREIDLLDREELVRISQATAEKIIDVFAKKEGLMNEKEQRRLRTMAKTVTFLTPDDMARLSVYIESLEQKNPFRLRTRLLKLKTGTFQQEDKMQYGFDWRPFGENPDDETEFIFVEYPNHLKGSTKTSRQLHFEDIEATVVEELMHFVDKMRFKLALLDNEEANVICHCALYAYARDAGIYPERWHKMIGEFFAQDIHHFRRLEMIFGKEELKQAYFGKKEIDFRRLIDVSKRLI